MRSGQEFNVGYIRTTNSVIDLSDADFSAARVPTPDSLEVVNGITRMDRRSSPRAAATVRNYNRSYYILACIFVLFLINQFCSILIEVPRVRLFERVICDRYYSDHDDRLLAATSVQVRDSGSKEELCKLPEIQSELATVIGIKTALDAIPGFSSLSFALESIKTEKFPGLLTASYYGSLADRIGRTPVALLCVVGELLALLSTIAICTRALEKIIFLMAWSHARDILIRSKVTSRASLASVLFGSPLSSSSLEEG